MYNETVELEAGTQEALDLRLVVDDKHDLGRLTHLLRFLMSGRLLA
jgi:hypothetical protein